MTDPVVETVLGRSEVPLGLVRPTDDPEIALDHYGEGRGPVLLLSSKDSIPRTTVDGLGLRRVPFGPYSVLSRLSSPRWDLFVATFVGVSFLREVRYPRTVRPTIRKSLSPNPSSLSDVLFVEVGRGPTL